MNDRSSKISTDGGNDLRMNAFGGLDGVGLPDSRKPSCHPVASAKKARKGRVEVRREKSGRGGKTVTTLSAFTTGLSENELNELTRDLKKKLACGGALKGRVIELQGDRTETVVEILEAKCFQPVRAGG